jgi:hydroxyacylglutathione hydrolase
MNVIVIPMLQDNFCYYLYSQASGIEKGFFVDVSEPNKLQDFIKFYQGAPKLSHILTTHKHGDHSGGNKALLESDSTIKIYGGAHDMVPGCTHPVNEGDQISDFLEGVKISCMHTPCHTKGHILYFCESISSEKKEVEITIEGPYQHVKNLQRCIFTGDTLFLGGCGRFFEGSPDQMLSALDRIQELPDDTRIFCGHEYTVKNFEFGLMAEPLNENIHKFHKHFTHLIS